MCLVCASSWAGVAGAAGTDQALGMAGAMAPGLALAQGLVARRQPRLQQQSHRVTALVFRDEVWDLASQVCATAAKQLQRIDSTCTIHAATLACATSG